MLKPYYQADGVTLYHGDCKEILPQLRLEKSHVAIVSDPPWGINANVDYTRFNVKVYNGSFSNGKLLPSSKFETIQQDSEPFDPVDWFSYQHVALWGGHCFSNKLPIGCWLVWVKKPDSNLGNFLSDAELCWTNQYSGDGSPGVYVINHVWDGLNRESERGKTLHPTQKPVEVMKWTIEKLKLPSKQIVVLDPYCGSGSTLEAAIRLGYTTIGCEIEERYCEVAVKRLLGVPGEIAKEQERSEVATRKRSASTSRNTSGLRNRGKR